MGLLDTYRIKKALDNLHSLPDATSAQGAQALSQLKQIGKRAIPKLIDALGHAQSHSVIIDLLVPLAQPDTLPLFIQGLSHTDAPVVAGVAQVLSKSHTYDPNRLVELFMDSRISKTTLGKILVSHKERLEAKALLDLLDGAGREARTTICRLLDEVATEAMLPDLIRATQHDDWTVRLSLVRALAHFSTTAVRDTLVRLLQDPHKNVRQAALEGLAQVSLPLDIQPICALLRDPDLAVQGKAIETLIKIRDPHTVHHLIDILQDESEYVRRGAVEVLNAIGDASAIKDLLVALKDRDWWVKVRAADALGTIGGPKVVDAVLMLIRDEDAFIRRSAVEIINTTKDERAFDTLLEAIQDEDWWVKERAIDALASLQDKRAVPALLRVLEGGDDQASSVAIRALAGLGDARAIGPILAQLRHQAKVVRHEALRALSTLTDAAHVDNVVRAITALPAEGHGDTAQLATTVVTTLAEKFRNKTAFDQPTGVLDVSVPVIQPRSLMVDATPAELRRVMQEASSPALERRTSSPAGSYTPQTAPAAMLVMPAIDANTVEPGTILFDRYRVIRRVGRGGFGTVLLVEDIAVREEIILKFMNPHLAADERMVARFIHELRYARRIAHENVIRIHDFLMFGNSYAISMEYFPSHSLSEELRPRQPLNFSRGLKIIWEICSGMKAAHQVQVVHRDLKPPNILIGKSGMVKIVDFGLAAASSNLDTRLTKTGALVGTPLYMAPEQVESRKIDARTDIYSLGIIMYEMFTGRPPYLGDNSMSVLFKHVEGKAVPPRDRNPRIPLPLEAVIMKAMAVDPEQRFQTMDELRRSLIALSKEGGSDGTH